MANLFGRAHGFERAGNDLASAGALHFVDSSGLEEFGVRQDDAQLIIQAMKERSEFGNFFHRSPGLKLFNAQAPRPHQA
jgi:hypothetical protein